MDVTGVADALPDFDVRTRHELRVDAPPERALAAALAVTAAEAPILRVLYALRGLRAPARAPLWEAMQAHGFRPFDDSTLVAIGRPWTARGGLRAPSDFGAFAEPGWAKLALDFTATEGVLATETRVALTDDAARRAFLRYWRVVAPFSGIVRTSWLAAAKRRAEGG